ncbi:hypothetical protein VZT92_016369 [Zoarces viviparus]|uniref:B30.2/SPRY domain-containing protein n=1 Tax=Zoarces viviparus TaxID=48416 RepID=A0AAW1EWJ9_ZOAVI
MFYFPTPEDGGWTLCGIYNQGEEYLAHSFSKATLHVRHARPLTVGVFVDYEKGEVSFYDVDARILICCYSRCAFTEAKPALKALQYFMAGTSLNSRPKLYPLFGIFEGDYHSMLVIPPVAHTTYTYHIGLHQW